MAAPRGVGERLRRLPRLSLPRRRALAGPAALPTVSPKVARVAAEAPARAKPPELIEFERKLKTLPAEIQRAYREGGIEGYNKAVDQYNARIAAARTKAQREAQERRAAAGPTPEEKARIKQLEAAIAFSERVAAGEFRPPAPGVGPGIPVAFGADYQQSVEDVRRKLTMLRQAIAARQAYAAAGQDIPPKVQQELARVKAITLSKAAPFVNLATGRIDVAGALRFGVKDDVLRSLGVSTQAIERTRAQLGRAVTVRDARRLLRTRYEGDPLKAIEGGDIEAVRVLYGPEQTVTLQSALADRRLWERTVLPTLPAEYQTAYRAGDTVKLAALERQFAADRQKFERWLDTSAPESLRTAYREGGVEAYNRALAQMTADRAAAQAKVERLAPDAVSEAGVDLSRALQAGVSADTLKTAGFTDQQITDAREWIATQERPGIVRQIWRLLTPWVEESQETFLSYMKGWPKRVRDSFLRGIRGEPESQEDLKAVFEAERSAPSWARVLMGSTVMRAADGTYYRVLTGTPPMAGIPAGKAAAGAAKGAGVLVKVAKAAAPKRTITLPRVVWPERVDWDDFARAISRGIVSNADDAAKWVARRAPRVSPEPIGPTPGLKGKPPSASEVRRLAAAFNKSLAAKRVAPVTRSGKIALIPLLNPNPAKPASQWRLFRPGELTAERMQQLIDEWKKMAPTAALRQMNTSNLAVVAVAVDPTFALRTVRQASAAERTRFLRRASTNLQRAVRSEDAQKAQEAAMAQVANTTQTQAKQMVRTAQRAAQRVTSVPTPVPAPSLPSPPSPPPLRPLPPLPDIALDGRARVVRTVRVPAGAIAWRQGSLKSGDVIKYLRPPYTMSDVATLVGERPMGWVEKGRTPQETLQVIGEAKGIPKRIAIDLGWADVWVIGGRRIEFRKGGERTDVGMRLGSPTKGVTIGGGPPRPQAARGFEDILGLPQAARRAIFGVPAQKPRRRRSTRRRSTSVGTRLRQVRRRSA